MRRPDSILRPKDTVARMPPQGVETPMRAGHMGPPDIKKELADSAWESDSLSYSLTPGEQKYQELMKAKRDKIALLQSFDTIPKPKNDYKIQLEDIEEIDEAELAQIEEQKIEDRELTKRKLEEENFNREVEQFNRQSQAVRFGLPRPSSINFSKLINEDELSEAEKCIRQEVNKMLIHDNSKFPLENTKPVNRALGDYPEYSISEIQAARDLIAAELEQQEDFDHKEDIIQEYENYIDEYCKMSYLPSKNFFYHTDDLTENERKEADDYAQSLLQKQLDAEQKKISSIEDKLRDDFNKIIEKERENRKIINDLVTDLTNKSRHLEVFQVAQSLEKKIIQIRVEEQKKFLRQQEAKEKELQQMYYDLTHKSAKKVE